VLDRRKPLRGAVVEAGGAGGRDLAERIRVAVG
jgi:hypothetical protein